MNILKIIILSIVSEIVLFLLTKIMGNKQISQITMFDYIIGITIGSIAAEMATALETNFAEPLTAMIVYALIALLISFTSSKLIVFRRFLYGTSIILLDNGILYKENFKTAKLDLNEFLAQCRTSGFFNINDIQTAILESNGKISFLPKSKYRPTTPNDLNINVDIEKTTTNIIIDGKVLKENLQFSGNDEMWLQKKLISQNINDASEVFLAFCDNKNNLSIYKNNLEKNSHDNFN